MCVPDSWTVKKAEHRRIDAFELWCWGRLLRVPWTARRSNQFILKEISPGGSFFIILFYFLTLQYCIGFAIYQHESATGIHTFPILNPPPSLYHPSESSQCISPRHPISCIEPGLATHFIYDIIHVSVFFGRNDAKAETPVLWPPEAKS